jgi:hypothetical protein
MKAARFFETSRTRDPATPYNNCEDPNPPHKSCVTSNLVRFCSFCVSHLIFWEKTDVGVSEWGPENDRIVTDQRTGLMSDRTKMRGWDETTEWLFHNQGFVPSIYKLSRQRKHCLCYLASNITFLRRKWPISTKRTNFCTNVMSLFTTSAPKMLILQGLGLNVEDHPQEVPEVYLRSRVATFVKFYVGARSWPCVTGGTTSSAPRPSAIS